MREGKGGGDGKVSRGMEVQEGGYIPEENHESSLVEESAVQQAGNTPVISLDTQTGQVSNQMEEHGGKQKVKPKPKSKTGKQATPPTIGVMFIDQTPGGMLAKKLQEVEDRLAGASGYRIRMVELSGTQLQRLLPNTNPWSGQNCGRINCYTCDQGGEVLQDCKRRNILYESKCVICNPREEESKKKEGAKDLNKSKGIYVGESARSIFERAGEHQADRIAKNEDSHMVKHWLSSHRELNSPPKFRVEVVGSYQDAMTRQIAEAVRIDLRGEDVLNSKSEYSRCKIPRLVIDQDDWRINKKKEKAELEPKMVEVVVEVTEDGEETTVVLEEEIEFGMIENRSKINKRRKADETGQPAKKKKKFENLSNWGDEDTAEDDQSLRDWLESDGNKDTLIEGVQTVVNKAIDTKRLKQLELDFVRRITEEWPSLNPVTDQEGWKEPAKKKRKKSLKKLAKENSKVSDWLGTKKSAITEVNESTDAIREDVEIMEIEISEECNQPNPMMTERLLKRDRLLEVWNGRRIVKELIVEMVGMVPELAAENMYKMMTNKKARAVDRKMIGDLVSEMTMEVPGVSVATNIMREVLEMACWRARVNQVWAIMEGDRRIQRLIEWRMDNQRMDERITVYQEGRET